MATDDETGSANVRATEYDATIKGIAERSYKFKQAVTINTTSAWTNFYYREDPAVLNAQSGNAIRGIPRGATYPNANAQWEQVQSVIEKYGLESNIPWEDILANQINVQNRTLIKIAEGVTKSVDDSIFATLVDGGTYIGTTPTSAQYIDLGGAVGVSSGNGGGWNQTSSAFIDNLLYAKQLIAEANYPTSNLMLFLSPRDARSAMRYITDKGAQFNATAESVVSNGRVGGILGITFVESNSVTTSCALLVVPKRCANWAQLYPLTTITKEDPLKSVLVRSAELGVTQLTDPLAVVVIRGTNLTQ